MRAGKLVEHGGDHLLDVVFLVAQAVVKRPKRGVDDLQLRRGQVEPIGDLVRPDQVIRHGETVSRIPDDYKNYLLPSLCAGARRLRVRLARMSAAGPRLGRVPWAGRIEAGLPSASRLRSASGLPSASGLRRDAFARAASSSSASDWRMPSAITSMSGR